MSRTVNNERTMTLALMSLAIISTEAGDYITAAQQYEESLAICRQMQNSQQYLPLVLVNIGDLKVAQRDTAKARECYEEALVIALMVKNRREIASALAGFADLFCAQGRYIQSARLHGFTMTQFNELGGLPVGDIARTNKTLDILKASLGQDSYEKEFAIGMALQQEQAIAYALENRE